MSWEWDRGSINSDPFSKMKDEDLSLGEMWNYGSTREKEDAELDRLREDPAIIAMVAKRTKKSIGRTAEMPIMCGSRETERSLAFGIVNGKAELVIVWELSDENGLRSSLQGRLTGEDTSNVPLHFACVCDAGPRGSLLLRMKRQGSRRTRLWLYRAAAKAMVTDTRKRPSVQLHT